MFTQVPTCRHPGSVGKKILSFFFVLWGFFGVHARAGDANSLLSFYLKAMGLYLDGKGKASSMLSLSP